MGDAIQLSELRFVRKDNLSQLFPVNGTVGLENVSTKGLYKRVVTPKLLAEFLSVPHTCCLVCSLPWTVDQNQ